MMNYKNIALRELEDFAKEFENYSLGEILYSFLRPTHIQEENPLKWLKMASDEDIYTVIEKARSNER